MVNAFYTAWIDSILNGLVADPLQAHLISPAYVPDPDNHTALSDIPVAAIISTAGINGAAVQQGRFTCSDIVWANMAASTDIIQTIVVSNQNTSALVAFLQNVNGLKVAPNGNDAVLQFDADCGLFGI